MKGLAPALQALDVHGACDQWLTNDDVLLWPERTQRLRAVYGVGRAGDRG